MKVCFISGHLDITAEEFRQHYVPSIDKLHSAGYSFVVGDARGTDTIAQEYLWKLGADVIVYHMFDSPRNNYGFKTAGGFASDNERDKAMTAASSVDIAWVRPGREKSGTARNLARRK